MFISKKLTQPPTTIHNPAPEDPFKDYEEDTIIGSFSGYIRRSKPLTGGMMAQIFGENGEDADVISYMHLTKFQDQKVKVTVWFIKNFQGKIQKDENNKFIKISEFIGIVRRPSPSNFGQTAQFFGLNGVNSDNINNLNKSVYQDGLVYVEIRKTTEGDTVLRPIKSPDDSLTEESKKLVPEELARLKKYQKKAVNAMSMLKQSGFFRNQSVLSSLGNEADFSLWIQGQKCSCPGVAPCLQKPIIPTNIPSNINRKYNLIPFCEHHNKMLENGVLEIEHLDSFMEAQRIKAIQSFALEKLRRILGVMDNYEPMPSTVWAWARENGLISLMPKEYLSFLEIDF